jgi:diguanylate cyclase (GGDEF)-like protein/PAS domain S-box-containing protein
VITLPQLSEPVRLLVRLSATGPARLSLAIQPTEQLAVANQYFDRSGGVLFGSLLMIAAFSGLIALLAKDFTFFLFGAWVVTSLRLASYSAGWDLGWLGYQEAEDFPILVKNLPLGAYAVFTVALFWAIFRRDIASLRATRTIRVLIVLSLGLFVAGALLPHRTFLPLLWFIVVPSVSILIWLTGRIFIKTGSKVAAWYAASWFATLAGALSEVAFAAGIVSTKPALLGSLGGSIVSALLAGIALGQRINSEKSGRIAAQSKTLGLLGRFRENYNSMPVGLFSVGSGGILTLYNPAFATMFGIHSNGDDAPRLRVDSLLGSGAEVRMQDAATRRDIDDLEFEVATGQRPTRWFLARVSAKEGSIEGSIQDITTRKEAESRLRHLVDHDPLTALLNRRGLEEAMVVAQASVSRGNTCAIAHVDLDRFKLINDLYGHATGDALLQAAATRLACVVRGSDFVARIADSFVIVLMDCPENAVVRLTERLRESISEEPFEIEGKILNVTVSIGVVAIETTMSPVDAMAAADRACSEAKSRGRNCVVRLNEQDATLKSHLEELKMVADLQRRVETDRYFLEFQPIVSLRSAHQSLSYEVLIRMRAEDGSVVPPGRFIGAAERNGLMSQIDRWVLRSTLEWLDANPAHRDRLTFATINLSGASLNDARFINDAFAMISEHPLAMTKLCFEITESVALHDVGSTRRFVDRVRAYGSKVALDDFGAGYTSFNYLKELPADFIKIDGSFVRDINRDPANYAITRTIVDLTHELGMSSIAEWAETADTVASLIELGVDYGQGFGLARPMPKELVTQAISSGMLVRDAAVQSLLSSNDRKLISLHAASPRRR